MKPTALPALLLSLLLSSSLHAQSAPLTEEAPSVNAAAALPACRTDATLDSALETIAPELRKWGTVCLVRKGADGKAEFDWVGYKDTAEKTDFWPASTIKLYAVVAVLELLTDEGFPLDTLVQFEHQEGDRWILDCGRSVREMLSEVFRRSSNEDYTLLLRTVGIDRINTNLFTPERGFPHTALMRGYVLERPYCYKRSEAQRITLRTADSARIKVIEHSFSGRSYSEERGCTVIDAKTGNVTSPRELAECLRRILFHEQLPAGQRYRLTEEQLTFLRQGGAGLVGLETRNEDSGPTVWNGVKDLFPQARFYHKCGVISNYALEVAAVDDSANSGLQFIVVPVINAGEDTKPETGQKLVSRMARAIGEWLKTQPQK